MVMKRVLAATAAVALAMAPAAATAQVSAAPLAIESVEGSQLAGESSALIGIGVFVVIVVAFLLIAESDELGEDISTSP
jgi:hypothetical protein